MRTKQALKNVFFSLLLQVVVAISGIIIPRFFIELYGSSVNGLVSSINQFITCMGLVEAGIGAAGAVALYKPLAEKNDFAVSQLVSAARKFYLRSGLIFAALVILLILIYPYAVHNEITDLSFIRTMIFILSFNGLVDYFYLGKYRVLLQADQRAYIISIAQIVGTIVMTILSILLMEMECSALLVKSVVAIVYLLRSLAVGIYVRKKYPHIDLYAEPNMKALSQRWAALTHQVAGMVVTNTDLVVLTLCISENALVVVSIYSVYNLVSYALSSLMTSISNGLGSGFGEVIAKDEKDVLKSSFSNYEFAFFLIIFIAYTCMASLMYPFVEVYSSSFTDGVNYLSWGLVVLFSLLGVLQSIRLPGLTIICAAGHYKQTQNRAILEAVINVGVSLALVKPLGIYGVLIGTCASYLYRTTDVIVYTARHFLPGTLKRSIFRIFRSAVLSILLILSAWKIVPADMSGWLSWLLWAILDAVIVTLIMTLGNVAFEPKEFRTLLNRLLGLIHRNKK